MSVIDVPKQKTWITLTNWIWGLNGKTLQNIIERSYINDMVSEWNSTHSASVGKS